MSELRAKLYKPLTPAMPFLEKAIPADQPKGAAVTKSAKISSSRPHQDHIAEKGYISELCAHPLFQFPRP